MALSETITLFRSISGLFLGLTIFGLIVTPESSTIIQLFRILSMLVFAVATLTPVSNYQNRLRYIYTAIYIFGIIIAIPLLLHAYNRDIYGHDPDYAVMIFRLLQIEICIIFAIISSNTATKSISSNSDIFR